MKSIEFFRNIPFGQYVDTNSFLHLLSPAVKIVCALMLIVVVTAAGSLVLLSALAVFFLCLVLLSRVPPRFLLRGLVSVLWLLAIIMVFQLVFARRIPADPVFISIGNLYITYKTMFSLAVIVVRFVAFMVLVTLFTSVTTEGDTVAGIEFLLRPIAPVSPAVHAFALLVNIIFRFIPILVGELEIIVKAQVSRGSPFGGKRFFTGPIKAVKDYMPLLVPVTLRSLDKALLLADAMDARCYRTAGRTQYRALMHNDLQNFLLVSGLIAPAAVLALDIFLAVP